MTCYKVFELKFSLYLEGSAFLDLILSLAKARDDIKSKKACTFSIKRKFPIKFGPIKFGPIKFGPIKFGLIKFGLIKFGLIKFGPIKFGPIKFGPIKFGSIKFGPITFEKKPLKCRTYFHQTLFLVSRAESANKEYLSCPGHKINSFS